MRRTAQTIFRRRICGLAIVALALSWITAPVPAAARLNNGEISGLCAAEANRQERRLSIPKNLLRAISTVETGRWDDASRASFAWPWTVTAKGEGRYFPDKETAIRAVQTLQRQGVTNIDVGCMQINLRYHADAFETLDDAFEPASNVAYAARFLTELRKSKRSWRRAVRFYHSSDPLRQQYYGRKIAAAQRAIRDGDRRVRRRAAATQPPARAARNVGPAYSAGWPPRGYKAQRRMEIAARARAFRGRRR